MGLAAAAYSRSIDELSYPQYLLVFPMFLFCGVFYPVENLPRALQAVAWIFPLTSVNSLVRTLTVGLPFHGEAVAILLVWLVASVVAGAARDDPPSGKVTDRLRHLNKLPFGVIKTPHRTDLT